MPLFGRAKTEIELDLEHPVLMAGTPVRARVRLGEPDKRVQGGRLELLYRNTFKEDSTDSDGDRSTHKRTKDVVVATQPLGADGGVAAGEVELDLALPAGGPGTAPGSVEWQVRAVVDRKLGRDARAERPLTVLVGPDALSTWAQSPVAAPPEMPMRIEAAPRIVRHGERITGTLTIDAGDGVSARALRIGLKRVRFDPDRNTDMSDTAVAVLEDGLELAAGESRSWPFALEVPADAPPSFHAAHNHQHWYVEAVVDRRGRRDHVGRLEVVVHTAQS